MTAPPFDSIRRVRVGDIEIAHVDRGTGGVPIVLIHGFACGMRMWAGVIRELPRGRRVIAFDLRGHGQTGAPTDPAAYSAAQLMSDLSGLLDRLEVEQADLVGFSLGGGPALGLALSQARRVRRLVLADVGSGAESPWALTRLSQVWSQRGREGGKEVLVDLMLHGEFFRHLAARGPASRRYMAALLAQHPVHGIVNTLDQVLARRKSLFRMTGRLKAVEAPTLVLTGAQDFVCAKAGRLLARSIPGAVSHRIAGGSHMVPVEQPAAFAGAIARFLV